MGSLKSDVALKDLREIPLGAKRDEVEQARGGGAGLLETLDGRDISLVGEDWMSFLPFFEAVEGREARKNLQCFPPSLAIAVVWSFPQASLPAPFKRARGSASRSAGRASLRTFGALLSEDLE